MVEYLVKLLKDSFQVATLSRGYKRKTKGYVLASENSTALEIGDEPVSYTHLEKEQVAFYFSGLLDVQSNLYKELSLYLLNIHFLSPPPETLAAAGFGEYPAHYFSSFVNSLSLIHILSPKPCPTCFLEMVYNLLPRSKEHEVTKPDCY